MAEDTVVSVRLPVEVANRLAAYADELDRPRSWLIQQAIGVYLDGNAARRVDWTSSDERGSCGWGFLAMLHFHLPGDPDQDADELVEELRRHLEAAGAREVWSDLQGIRPLAASTTIRSYMPQTLHAAGPMGDPQNPFEERDQMIMALKTARDALRLTKEYVDASGELLPNKPGWSHYDATEVINQVLGWAEGPEGQLEETNIAHTDDGVAVVQRRYGH